MKITPVEDRTAFIVRSGIAILCMLFLAVVISRIVYPYSYGLEAFNWMPASHLLEGKNPYAFALKPPYGMSPYGIVYYAIIAFSVKCFGFQLWFGKLLTVVAFAVCILAAVKVTKNVTSSRTAVLVTFLACLAMFPAQSWIALTRPDLFAMAFALAALSMAFTLNEERKTSFWRIGGLVLLSSAAFFTKQTYVLPTAIVFLRFLQLRKWREALLFAAAFAAMTLSGIFLLNYTSSGGYVWQHFTHAQGLPYELSSSVRVFIEALKLPTFLVSLAFLLVFSYENRRFLSGRNEFIELLHSPKFLVLMYFLVSLILSFLSSGRLGGNLNYYLENSFVAAIVCGVIFEKLRRITRPDLGLAMVVLLVAGGAFQQVRVLRGEMFRWQALSYYREIFETVGRTIPPGSTCISVYPELVVWNGCEFNFDDFEEYNGDWTPELSDIFEREISSGRYAAIIWFDDKLSLRFPNYRLVPLSQSVPERYFPVYLYVPVTVQPK